MPDLNSLITSKLAFVVLIGSLVATGSTAMAAYAGALPDALQERAHLLIGAPEPGVEPADDALASEDLNDGTDADGTDEGGTDADGGATGPDAAGPAAFGLCTAHTNGGLSENSTAFKAFDEVEGGIDAYCAIVIGDKSEGTNKSEKSAKEHPATSNGNGGGKDR